MRFLAVIGLSFLLLINPPVVWAQDGPVTLPVEEDKFCDNGPAFGFCDFVVSATVVFIVIDWLVPLNQATADPYRCRGEGSVLNAPSPWGTSECAPLPQRENIQ